MKKTAMLLAASLALGALLGCGQPMIAGPSATPQDGAARPLAMDSASQPGPKAIDCKRLCTSSNPASCHWYCY
jgi:hypothetical protein